MPPDESSPDVESLLRESSWLDFLAQGLLSDENDARDVAQEARVAALEKAPDDATHARAWLVRVTRHLAFKSLRSRSRRRRRESLAATREALPATVDVVAKVHAQRRVVDAVLELEEPYRTVVLLRYFESLEPIEIARRQRSPPATIRTQLHRALGRLRQRLDSEFGTRANWATLLLPTVKGTAAFATVATTSVATKLGIATAILAAGVLLWSTAARPSKSSFDDEPQSAASSSGTGRAANDGAPIGSPPTGRVARESETARPTDFSTSRPSGHMRFVGRIVDARDRKPIAGAEIRIGDDLSDSAVWARTTSDASGRFDFVVESISSYIPKAEIRSPEFARWFRDCISLDEAINLRKDRRLDFGDVEMLRGASVKGRVVTGSDGRPVADAELRFYGDNEKLIRMWEFPVCAARTVGRSRVDGSFELSERIECDPTWPARMFAIEGDRIGWATIDPEKSAESVDGIEVVLHAQASVHVSVRGVGGEPISSARIRCAPHFSPIYQWTDDYVSESISFAADPSIEPIFEQRTDVRGHASFPKLPLETSEGRYDILITKDGFEPRIAYGVILESARPQSCDIELRPVRKVRVCGTVRDLQGNPISAAQVSCTAASDQFSVNTDSSGRFLIEDVTTSEGDFSIHVEAEGFFDGSIERSFKDSGLTPASASGVEDAPAFTADFVLFRRVAPRIVVVDEGGRPIASSGIPMMSVCDDFRMPPGILGRCGPQFVRRGDRPFEIASELEWEISAAAQFPERHEGPRSTVRVPGSSPEVVIRCASAIPPGAHVAVKFIDSTRGRATRVDFPRVFRADGLGEGGAIRCEREGIDILGLMPGRWQLEFRTWDEKWAVHEFDVATAADDLDLSVVVGESIRIDGRVESGRETIGTDSRGAARVAWSPRTGHAVDAGGYETDRVDGFATPDPQGRFRVVGLMAGRPIHFFARDGDLYDEVTIIPSAAESSSITLHPMPSANWTVHCREVLSSGIVAVDLAMGDEPWHREILCDHGSLDAHAVARPVKPGHHRWRALYLEPRLDEPNRPARAIEGQFDVAAGETATIELEGLR